MDAKAQRPTAETQKKKIAFSDDGTQALVYYDAAFAAIAGWGTFCLLARKNGRWTITAEYCAWIS